MTDLGLILKRVQTRDDPREFLVRWRGLVLVSLPPRPKTFRVWTYKEVAPLGANLELPEPPVLIQSSHLVFCIVERPKALKKCPLETGIKLGGQPYLFHSLVGRARRKDVLR